MPRPALATSTLSASTWRAPAGCASNCNLDDLPQPQCGEYDNWYRDINPHSAVLVFPAAYLNSPSSMFGHTLLRIDQADVTSNNTALLSYALNFGAYIEAAWTTASSMPGKA